MVEVEGLGKYKNCSLGVALKQTYITLLIIFFLSLKVLLKASFLYLHYLIIFKFHESESTAFSNFFKITFSDLFQYRSNETNILHLSYM